MTRWRHRGGRYRVVAKLSAFLQKQRGPEGDTDHTTIFPEGFFDPIFEGYREPKLVRWRTLVNRDREWGPVLRSWRPVRVDYRNPLAMLNITRPDPAVYSSSVPPRRPPSSDEYSVSGSLDRAEFARMELSHLPSIAPISSDSSSAIFEEEGRGGRAGIETLARKIEELEAMGHELPGPKRTVQGYADLSDESASDEPGTATNFALDDLESAIERALLEASDTKLLSELMKKPGTIWPEPSRQAREIAERPIDHQLADALDREATDLAAPLSVERLVSELPLADVDSSEQTPSQFRIESVVPEDEQSSPFLLVRSGELEAIGEGSDFVVLVDEEDESGAPKTQRDLASGALLAALHGLGENPILIPAEQVTVETEAGPPADASTDERESLTDSVLPAADTSKTVAIEPGEEDEPELILEGGDAADSSEEPTSLSAESALIAAAETDRERTSVALSTEIVSAPDEDDAERTSPSLEAALAASLALHDDDEEETTSLSAEAAVAAAEEREHAIRESKPPAATPAAERRKTPLSGSSLRRPSRPEVEVEDTRPRGKSPSKPRLKKLELKGSAARAPGRGTLKGTGPTKPAAERKSRKPPAKQTLAGTGAVPPGGTKPGAAPAKPPGKRTLVGRPPVAPPPRVPERGPTKAGNKTLPGTGTRIPSPADLEQTRQLSAEALSAVTDGEPPETTRQLSAEALSAVTDAEKRAHSPGAKQPESDEAKRPTSDSGARPRRHGLFSRDSLRNKTRPSGSPTDGTAPPEASEPPTTESVAPPGMDEGEPPTTENAAPPKMDNAISRFDRRPSAPRKAKTSANEPTLEFDDQSSPGL